ncbi:hypothetical protein ES319_D08G155800v1 [Gossypium barbadense]|uniref:DUF4283 domain-containing protein n=2 Tax=Gossypium TaxID=3633 RepID=A0A5J5QEE0_GOSBA|nr:hypothetical protein ES319_D08G155800v1 [Gossypium barbadense]TYG57720.1 hypothetical protein ES288_D08G165800v1 [Gossypium darwinii]
MSFSSTSFERPGSPVPEDLTRATKKVKNKSIDDQVLRDVVMKDGLPKVSCRDKFVGNVEGRGSKEEAVLEQELEITEDDYMINTEGEYLKIAFFERIHEWIDKSMAKTTVVRLLGKNIGYKALKDYDNALTGGPWVIYGHYLVVKREQFAGLAVMIDLKKPLVSHMGIDGHIQYMDYLKLQIKGKEVDSTEQTMVQASESVADTTVGAEKALG